MSEYMTRAIVTLCNESYSGLLEYWINALMSTNNRIPVFVLCLNNFVPPSSQTFTSISVDPTGNPFPLDLPDHACAEKLRIFQHIPHDISEVLFIDLDILVLHPFWRSNDWFIVSHKKLVMCPDLFLGYKEKMESEFQPYDPLFHMKFNHDGSYFYFNTGVFFASRKAHAHWFSKFLETWNDYVKTMLR